MPPSLSLSLSLARARVHAQLLAYSVAFLSLHLSISKSASVCLFDCTFCELDPDLKSGKRHLMKANDLELDLNLKCVL